MMHVHLDTLDSHHIKGTEHGTTRSCPKISIGKSRREGYPLFEILRELSVGGNLHISGFRLLPHIFICD